MAKKGLEMTLAQAKAHAAKHGYALEVEGGQAQAAETGARRAGGALPKPVRMTRPEREYGMILEAMKRRREIVDYRFQGMSLAWGRDPKTGILMRYKCDWVVIERVNQMRIGRVDGGVQQLQLAALKIIEVKGAHIFPKDLIRFKGCRAEWGMFQFEMWQLAQGEWRRVQ